MRIDKIGTAMALSFNPLLHSIAVSVPHRFDVATAWMGHVPFAMTLVDMIRPRVVVELGTHWGVSYCAFCQAVKEFGLSTRCYAVDTWQGDSHAAFYTDEVLDNLKEHHDPLYALFSKLVRSSFDDAVSQFEDGCIDLLHLDGYHTYDAVKHDFEVWLPKVSGRGVVILHDTEVRDREAFGVWRFWDEIKNKYPHFEFKHSYGLGVIAIGEVPEQLKPILGMPAVDQTLVRNYFSGLGAILVRLNSVSIENTNLSDLAAARGQECERLDAQCSQLSEQRMQMETRLSEQRVQMETRCAQLSRALDAKTSESAEAKSEDERKRIRELAGLTVTNCSDRLPKELRGLKMILPQYKKKYTILASNYLLIASSPLFDRNWYLSKNPDVRNSGIDPVLHYLTCGSEEGRRPGPLFDGAEYLTANPDVREAKINPLVHYIQRGRNESRPLSRRL